MSERLPDWEQRFNAYIASVRTEPHAYGRHDCLLHCAAAVQAVTGDDFGGGHRDQYCSAAAAVRYLQSLGFDSPEAMVDSLFEEIPIGFAQRGDLVLTQADGGGWPVPASCLGGKALCAGGAIEPRTRWLKAWKVGR